MVSKQDFKINNYRARKIKDKYLVTTDHGSWIALDRESFLSLKRMKIKRNSKIFNELEEKGIVLTKDNIAQIIEGLRGRYGFLLQGTSLHIVVPTLRCNMKCIYCHASSRLPNAKGYDMDKKTAKKIVDFIFQSPSRHITIEFQGGEPLLNFDIVKYIINYANELNVFHNKDLLTSIVTNLTLMDGKKLDFLLNNNVTICTSLDGPKEVHDYNRAFIQGRGTHAEVTKQIARAGKIYAERGITDRKMNALITLTKKSLKYPKAIVDEYVKNNLTDIHLRFLNNLGCAKGAWVDISYSASDFIEFWKQAMDYIIKINKEGKPLRERIVMIILKKILEKEDPNYVDLRSPCGAAIGQLVYDYDGSIYTCDEGRMLGEDVFKLGNAKNNNFREVLTSNHTCGIVAASANDVQICDNCAYKPYCGICPICNYAEQGSIIAKIPQTDRCKIFKAQFDFVFDKLFNDEVARKVFLSWVND
ncbi:His-Xaa-Ser system radical SAM maturase HxsB [Candidatus Woesearchaeota archaeon]|nr:His-Xaa-Ser system radical SAM maturase HxsB [Candidatus Woesearchaeota archaeon]